MHIWNHIRHKNPRELKRAKKRSSIKDREMKIRIEVMDILWLHAISEVSDYFPDSSNKL